MPPISKPKNGLGDLLVEWEEKTGKKAASIAHEIGVNPKIVYRIINNPPGSIKIRQQIIQKLSILLGASLSDLSLSALKPGRSHSGKEIVYSTAHYLSGKWIVFYVECHKAKDDPYICEETLFIKQDSGRAYITGEYIEAKPYGRSETFLMNAGVLGDIVIGRYHSPTRSDKNNFAGEGSFQLKIYSNDEYLDGFCSWLDSHSTHVEGSRCMWLREGIQDYEIYKNWIGRTMLVEIEVFRTRRDNTQR